jgi:uncharacterized protein
MEAGEREEQPIPVAGSAPPPAGAGEPAVEGNGEGGGGADPGDRSGGRGRPFGRGLGGISWGPAGVIAGALIALGASIVFSLPIAAFDPDLETTAGEVIAQLAFVVALMLGAVSIVSSKSESLLATFRSLGFHKPDLGVFGWAAIAYCIYIAAAIFLAVVLSPEQEDIARGLGADEEGVWGLIAAGFLIVVCAPIAEEVFFRGFLYGGLRRALPVLPAALISSVLFGVAHLATGNLAVAVQLAVFGVVAAGLYEYRGNLWGPIALHTVNNTIAFLVLVTDAA